MNDELGFLDAVKETKRLLGDPPLIGTFTPTLGDIGRDAEGLFWVWDGKQFIDGTGRRGKTFDEWMGFA